MAVKYSSGVKFLFARHVGNQIVDTVNVAREFNFLSHYPITRECDLTARGGRAFISILNAFPMSLRAFNY